MNQEKIGKFIKEKRKNKNITQQELGELLGVSEKTVSNWERGRNMPDLSLFVPLCEELDISVNELINGKEINLDEMKEKTDQNIINTINFSNNKINNQIYKYSLLLLLIGIIISITFMIINNDNTLLLNLISFLGFVISFIGFYRLIKIKKIINKIITIVIFGILYLLLLMFIDYLCVLNTKRIPRFCFKEEHYNNIDLYHTPFYNVYKINKNNKAYEYTIVDKDKEYTIENVPISPFNREIVGYNSISKYESNKLEKDNIFNLYKHLPLYNFEFNIELDTNNNGITINYDINTDENHILDINNFKRELLYNCVSSFFILEKLNYIKYSFNKINQTYYVERNDLINYYEDYKYISRGNDRREYFFNNFVEKKMNDYNYYNNNFKKIFMDSFFDRITKIEMIKEEYDVENDLLSPFIFKTITNQDDIKIICNILINSSFIKEDSPVTLEGPSYKMKMYDQFHNVSLELVIFNQGFFGIEGKEYLLMTEKNKLFSIIN